MSGATVQQQPISDEYQSTKSFNFFVKDPKVKIFTNVTNDATPNNATGTTATTTNNVVAAASPHNNNKKERRQQQKVDDDHSNDTSGGGSSNNQVGVSTSCLLDSAEASGSLGKNSTSVQTRKVGEHHLSHWFLKKEDDTKKKNKKSMTNNTSHDQSPQRGIVKKKKKKQQTVIDVSNALPSSRPPEPQQHVFQPIIQQQQSHQQQHYHPQQYHGQQQEAAVQPIQHHHHHHHHYQTPQQQHYSTTTPASYNQGSISSQHYNFIQPSYNHTTNVGNNAAQRGFVPYTHQQYQTTTPTTQNNMTMMVPTTSSPPQDVMVYNNHSHINNYSRVSSPVHHFDGVSGRPCWDSIGPYCHSPVSNSTNSVQKQFPPTPQIPSSATTLTRTSSAPFGGIFEKHNLVVHNSLPPLSALLTTPPEKTSFDKPQPSNALPSLSCLLYNKPEQ